MIIPRDQLPTDRHARHSVLRAYFCDKDVEAVEVAEGWRLDFYWPGDAERHVDPQLGTGLAWWGADVGRSSMAFAQRREGRVLTCLYDTITLLSWSEWLARQNAPPTDLVILHVDDHRDLGTPRLFTRNGALVDGITGEPVALAKPSEVTRAIESGALGMGSFLTPFLHMLPRTEVRHLCQPPKVTGTTDTVFILTKEADTLLKPGAERPAVRLEPGKVSCGPGTYRITNRVHDWLANLGNGPILLHIDMDYFNNRYDGDSEWKGRQAVLDASLDTVLSKIDELADALERVSGRIEDAVVAYSPGFFPAELWAAADSRLHAMLPELYAF